MTMESSNDACHMLVKSMQVLVCVRTSERLIDRQDAVGVTTCVICCYECALGYYEVSCCSFLRGLLPSEQRVKV